ncbi:arylsulfatase G-like isoform X2 [Bacillus rossius redtenbacheri]
MTDFHAGASVCSPSRAALLTGRLGLRTGVVRNFVPESVGGIPTSETTLGEVLQGAGYRTAMLGKWHLGLTPGHHPVDRGFSCYLGVPYSVDMGCSDVPGDNLPQCQPCLHDNSIHQFSELNTTKCLFDYIGLPLYCNKTICHQPVSLPELSKAYASFAQEFIHNSDGRPYFLYAALSHVHVPLAHATQFENITGHGVFADTLYELDWLVGVILSAVATAPGGDNTLVWFTSDNGPWEAKCSLAGSAGGFTASWQRTLGGGGSGSKATVWEGGHRVPSIVYWPGVVQAGVRSDALLSALDILPTLLRITNASLPLHRRLDGRDMSSVILGSSNDGHQVLFHPNGNLDFLCSDVGAVRIGTYKVVYYTGGVADCSGRAGPLRHYPDVPLIFDLAADPTESSPLDSSGWAYLSIQQAASEALLQLEVSIRTDNVSTVNYGTSAAAKPCCWGESPICRCPWD